MDLVILFDALTNKEFLGFVVVLTTVEVLQKTTQIIIWPLSPLDAGQKLIMSQQHVFLQRNKFFAKTSRVTA